LPRRNVLNPVNCYNPLALEPSGSILQKSVRSLDDLCVGRLHGSYDSDATGGKTPLTCDQTPSGRRVCHSLSRGMALPTKIRPEPGPPRTGLRPWGGDEAESEGCGGSTVEDDNEVWPDFRRNPGSPARDLCVLGWKPKGWGQFFPFHRLSSLGDTRYPSLLLPRTEKNWLPAPPVGK
jgi:hypothetical protein